MNEGTNRLEDYLHEIVFTSYNAQMCQLEKAVKIWN